MDDQLATVTQMEALTQADPLDRNPAAVYLAGLSIGGRRTMIHKLTVVARLLGYEDLLAVPWADLRFQHVAALRAKLIDRGYAPATVNGTLYALRGVVRACFNLGALSVEELERIRNVKPVRGDRLLRGRALSAGEIGALMGVCAADEGLLGVRDAALIGLLYAGGLRRAEIVALTLEDYTTETGELVVRGKGNKERLLWVNNGAQDALDDWVRVRGDEEGALFCPVNRGGRMICRHLTDQSVYDVLRKRATQAAVKSFSPHDLRRTFVSDLLDAGADIATVQKLAGHAGVQTTARYDRRGEEAKRKAVGLLHVPYVKREVKDAKD